MYEVNQHQLYLSDKRGTLENYWAYISKIKFNIQEESVKFSPF